MESSQNQWKAPAKGSPEERKLIDLFKSFSSALRKIPLYPESHPMVQESILKLFTGIDVFVTEHAELAIDTLDAAVLICGQQVEALQAVAHEVTHDFKKFNVEGIVFKRGLTEPELGTCLRILTLKPEQIKEKGDIKQVLSEAGVTHVHLTEVKYARITDDEEVGKKGELSSEAAPPALEPQDIVAQVADFLGGTSNDVPRKDMVAYEFKQHARRIVKQLLKLVGPEKAIEEIIRFIEERFAIIGFTPEEQNGFVEKVRKEIIKVRLPRVSKRAVEKELAALRAENKQLKENLRDVDARVQQEVVRATQALTIENKKIKIEKQRINSVLRHVAEGLIIVDNDGKVLVLNPAAEQLMGMSKEDKVGKHILEGLREEQMVGLAKDQQHEIEIELAGPSAGTKKTLRASSAVIENEAGQTIGMVSVLSDITKQKELDRMKDSFVSNVSHELRAPLISIKKSIELILENSKDAVPAEMKQFLNIANNNATRLTALVNDLLDMAKLEAGGMKPACQTVNGLELVKSVFEMLGVWSQTRGVTLVPEVPAELTFDADQKMISQVVTNLVGNAIKFTPRGGSVTVRGWQDGDKVKVSVIDTGCGIPADSVERIFEKFEQAKSIRSPDTPKGTGLGLAIVKEIVTLHGGSIRVESQEGHGSTFTFEMPQRHEVLDIRD